MKLEYVANKAVFIAPKVYGLLLENGNNIVKIKGSKTDRNIDVTFLESLLQLDKTLELTQDRWFRDIENAKINIKSIIYTLKVTQNKRQLIYYNDIFKNTKPLVLENGEIVSPNKVLMYNDQTNVTQSNN